MCGSSKCYEKNEDKVVLVFDEYIFPKYWKMPPVGISRAGVRVNLLYEVSANEA